MANQVAIRSVTEPGDEIICHRWTHSYNYEGGGPAALSGCSMRHLDGPRGVFSAADVEAAVNPPDSHFARSRMVIVENTNNRGGGSVWPIPRVREVGEAARRLGLHVHLDGARLMNACAAAGCKPAEFTRHVDSVSMCFSKGLGAPVGSIVAGEKAFIDRAHRFRKMFGGGMRQAGILAAAALYAIEHNVERLSEDHANARRLAEGIAELPGIRVNVDEVETNIVYFGVDADAPPTVARPPSAGSRDAARPPQAGATTPAQRFVGQLRERGVWMFDVGPDRVRAVTHMDVSREQVDRAIDAFRALCGKPNAGAAARSAATTAR
jgi:threonine aldolase